MLSVNTHSKEGCNIGPTIMILLILHPFARETGKFASRGPHYAPAGRILPPSGLELRSTALWRQYAALGRIMFGPRAANVPVSRAKGCRISNIIMVGPILHHL